MIETDRIRILNNNVVSEKGNYILYFVQTAPRTKYNHALNLAIETSNESNLPLICYFELNTNFPHSNTRNLTFLLQGLNNFKENLQKLGIQLVIGKSEKDTENITNNARDVITDRGYLYFHKKREDFLKKVGIRVTSVETNVAVPVETASNKQEYSAFLFRKKINPILNNYLKPISRPKVNIKSLDIKIKTLDISNIEKVINDLKLEKLSSINMIGGESTAEKYLEDFINIKLEKYSKFKNDPSKDFQSNLSPYLHFGHISPIYIALKCLDKFDMHSKNIEDFFNELIIWRELARNYCYYNSNYDNFEGLPNWAKTNLLNHKTDKREFIYSKKQFEEAKTHDKYWNTAQIQLLKTGKIHGYMRMYWGKKVIEWNKNPQEAYEVLVYLNDKYSIDGRDENGYAGIGWCFGLHDRPHFTHKVLGNVRYMAEKGLVKKFDAEKYVAQFLS